MKSRVKRSFIMFMKSWGYVIIASLIIAFSFKSAVAEINVVPTGSMIPTILEGDRIIVNKLAYDLKVPFTTFHIADWGNPERGDIVVLKSPADHNRLVKRVIGVPGDIIEMRDNRLVINGEKLSYKPVRIQGVSYLSRMNTRRYSFLEDLSTTSHPVMITPESPSDHASFGPVKIPENKYFLMGDNRDNSKDSRYFGFVDRNLILGKANSIFYSLDINNKYIPRWGRFFSRLL